MSSQYTIIFSFFLAAFLPSFMFFQTLVHTELDYKSIISSNQGYLINGSYPNHRFGNSLSRKNGDFNGDGFNDLIIGSCNPTNSTRIAYVLFGSENGFVRDLNLLNGSNGFSIIYNNYFFSGRTHIDCFDVANDFIGDINSDGFDDIMVCTQKNGKKERGYCFLIYGDGKWSTGIIDLRENFKIISDIGGKIFTDNLQPFSTSDSISFGYAFGGLLDINNDGKTDFAMSNMASIGIKANETGDIIPFKNGKYYIILDINSFETHDNENNNINYLSSSSQNSKNFIFLEDEPNNLAETHFGRRIAALGDINGDGFNDFIVSGFREIYKDLYDFGAAYVIYGSKKFANKISMNEIYTNQTDSFKITSNIGYSSYLGYDLQGEIDINGDGINDIVVSGSHEGTEYGFIYVIFGTKQGFPKLFEVQHLDGTNGFIICEWYTYYKIGVSLAKSDINKDGIDDLLIGVSGSQAVIIYGRKTFPPKIYLDRQDLYGENIFSIKMFADGNKTTVSAIGDINNDTILDYAIGSPERNSSTGAVLIVNGGALSQYVECAKPFKCAPEKAFFDSKTQGVYSLSTQNAYDISKFNIYDPKLNKIAPISSEICQGEYTCYNNTAYNLYDPKFYKLILLKNVVCDEFQGCYDQQTEKIIKNDTIICMENEICFDKSYVNHGVAVWLLILLILVFSFVFFGIGYFVGKRNRNAQNNNNDNRDNNILEMFGGNNSDIMNQREGRDRLLN